MKHWRIEQMNWDRFDPRRVDPDIVPLVKAASVVERNGLDYACYLKNVFADDPDFSRAADNWAQEEVQHGDALGRWAMLADPSWDYMAAFDRYRQSYRLDLDVDASIRGSRTGELIARCMVTESEDDELASAFHTTNEPSTVPYDHKRCIAAYMSRALRFYQPRHAVRVTGMILKTIGWTPHGRLHALIARAVYRLLMMRQRKFARVMAVA